MIMVQMISLQCSQSSRCISLSRARKALSDMPDLLSSRTNFIFSTYALVALLVDFALLVRYPRVFPCLDDRPWRLLLL